MLTGFIGERGGARCAAPGRRWRCATSARVAAARSGRGVLHPERGALRVGRASGLLVAFSQPPVLLNGTIAIVLIAHFVLISAFTYGNVSAGLARLRAGI